MNALRAARQILGAVLRRPDVRASLAILMIGVACKDLAELAGEQRDQITAGRIELAQLQGQIAAARSAMRATDTFAATMKAAKEDAANRLRAAFTADNGGVAWGEVADASDELAAAARYERVAAGEPVYAHAAYCNTEHTAGPEDCPDNGDRPETD